MHYWEIQSQGSKSERKREGRHRSMAEHLYHYGEASLSRTLPHWAQLSLMEVSGQAAGTVCWSKEGRKMYALLPFYFLLPVVSVCSQDMMSSDSFRQLLGKPVSVSCYVDLLWIWKQQGEKSLWVLHSLVWAPAVLNCQGGSSRTQCLLWGRESHLEMPEDDTVVVGSEVGVAEASRTLKSQGPRA